MYLNRNTLVAFSQLEIRRTVYTELSPLSSDQPHEGQSEVTLNYYSRKNVLPVKLKTI